MPKASRSSRTPTASSLSAAASRTLSRASVASSTSKSRDVSPRSEASSSVSISKASNTTGSGALVAANATLRHVLVFRIPRRVDSRVIVGQVAFINFRHDECACVYDGICGAESELPKTEARISKIPGAGLGLFACEDIKKGTLIGVFEGKVIQSPKGPNWDLFDIAKGFSLDCAKEGPYFANEQAHNIANAQFGYMESKRRREITLRAKQDIETDEEITAQYGDPKSGPCFPSDDLRPGIYALITGQESVGKIEPWFAKILEVEKQVKIKVQWLLRKQDLHYMPSHIRKGINLEDGELIMTKGWIDTISGLTFQQVVLVSEERPKGDLCTNTFWWTRTYDAKKQKMV
ncbi:hypothetical protein B0J11DRAFT_618485 [Dendryphion nanum]|uniref:SET domain-containing protein n=1 Tax=Dendryphion nanum TaxID=256645 RepID=A0A9P9IC56_9PLEO|nr:hypothetical protein B0J11DRAFT_618485 [Dendryphion nanum]